MRTIWFARVECLAPSVFVSQVSVCEKRSEVSNTINKKRITSAEKLLVDVDALRSLWIS